jgi:hypothetical protein
MHFASMLALFCQSKALAYSVDHEFSGLTQVIAFQTCGQNPPLTIVIGSIRSVLSTLNKNTTMEFMMIWDFLY